MGTVTLTTDEYADLLRLQSSERESEGAKLATRRRGTRRSRKASASSKKYGRAFKRLAPRYKKKDGGWKKGGFKACVRAAHKAARK